VGRGHVTRPLAFSTNDTDVLHGTRDDGEQGSGEASIFRGPFRSRGGEVLLQAGFESRD